MAVVITFVTVQKVPTHVHVDLGTNWLRIFTRVKVR